MHLTPPISRCLAACLAVLALTAVLGCTSRHNPWLDSDKGQFLADKVKTNHYAYLRYAQAEEEARRDGDAAAADRYRQAKDTARQEYERYNQELSQYNAGRSAKVQAGAP